MQQVYFTQPEYLSLLQAEFSHSTPLGENALLSSERIDPVFAVDVWHDCETLHFQSIKEAANLLKERARLWAYDGRHSFRRGALIGESLRLLKTKPIVFGSLPPLTPFGIYTLLDEHTLLLCKTPKKPIPLGQIEFIENKTIPPNRAYLKLWEIFTLLRQFPKAGETCLDVGASPGGWSWVLAECGAQVISIDKAPLAPHIAKNPHIHFQQGSAFALDPKDFDAIDWFCSDIICYPKRLVSLIERWLESGKVRHMICTIKLQGNTDWDSIRTLQAIPGATVQHLWHNKHELCFYYFKEKNALIEPQIQLESRLHQ